MAEKKKSKMKVILIVVAILLVLFIGFVILVSKTMTGNSMFTEETVSVRDISTFYTFSGTVDTESESSIAAEISQKVVEVKVEEGDEVKAGDIIAILDSTDIEKNIKIKETVMSSTDVSDTYNLNSVRKTYEDFKASIDNGTNSQLNSAKSAVENARINLENAKKNYDEARKNLEDNDDSGLVSARKAVDNAKLDLKEAQKSLKDYQEDVMEEEYKSIEQLKDAMDDAKDKYDYLMKDGYDIELQAAQKKAQDAKSKYDLLNSQDTLNIESIAAAKAEMEAAQKEYEALAASIKTADELKKEYTDAKKDYDKAKADIDKNHADTLDKLERAVNNAENALDAAERNLADTEKRLDDSVESYFDNYESAKRNYDDAVKNLESTELNIEQTLDSYKTSYDRTVDLSQYSTDTLELDTLYSQLEDCTIKADNDGKVAAVNVKEGAYITAGQTAAVVIDYSELIVNIKIDEYDIMKVSEGNKVEIYVNALDKTVTGTITDIASNAEVSAGVSYFPAKISIDECDDIRVGMSVEVKLISRFKADAISIVADAVQYDENNNAFVYVKSGDTQEKRNVTLGITDGTYIEIVEGLSENEIVLYTPPITIDMEMLLGM